MKVEVSCQDFSVLNVQRSLIVGVAGADCEFAIPEGQSLEPGDARGEKRCSYLIDRSICWSIDLVQWCGVVDGYSLICDAA